jgi:enoyl-CoA hydratase/carnithine racemase
VRREWSHFSYEEDGGVATVYFDRPGQLNELAFEVFRDVRDLADDLRVRGDEIRVVVLRGEGAGFCSADDVEMILTTLAEADSRDVYDFAQVTGACVRNLRRLPQPVIAAVNGLAAGAGAVLAMACDLRLLVERARFQFLFTRIGIAGGDTAVCWLLPRLIGLGRASEVLLMNDGIDSETALEFGLANRVVPDDELEGAVDSYLERLLAAEPAGLAMTKDLLERAVSDDPSVELDSWAESLPMTRSEFREFRAGFSGRKRPASGT